MPQRSESMASSTARGRQEEGGGVPNLPTEKKRCCGCYFAQIVVKATKPYSTCPSLCHIHTLTLISGCAPLLLSSEQGSSQILVQSLVSPPCNLQSPVHMCKCVVCKVCVCVCGCRWCMLRPPWCTAGWEGFTEGLQTGGRLVWPGTEPERKITSQFEQGAHHWKLQLLHGYYDATASSLA